MTGCTRSDKHRPRYRIPRDTDFILGSVRPPHHPSKASPVNDLSRARLDRLLTGRFGKPYMLHATTGSTNDDALAWAARGAPEGALVAAEHQTAGRGRWDRRWLSRPGASLLFSVLLRPERPASALGLLTTAAGVAVAEGIEEACGLPCGLRWPNDVTAGGRKLAGVLVETRLRAGTVTGAAVLAEPGRSPGRGPGAPGRPLRRARLSRPPGPGHSEVGAARAAGTGASGRRRGHRGHGAAPAPLGRPRDRRRRRAGGSGVRRDRVAAPSVSRPWRPSREELGAAAGRRVPDVISTGLDVLFCGINP